MTVEQDQNSSSLKQEKIQAAVSVDFVVSEDRTKLFAKLSPAPQEAEISVESLRQSYKTQNFTFYRLNDELLHEVTEKAASLKYGRYPIGSIITPPPFQLFSGPNENECSAQTADSETFDELTLDFWDKAAIKLWIRQSQYSQYQIDNDALDQLCEAVQNGKSTQITLGEKGASVNINLRFDSESSQLFADLYEGQDSQDLSISGIQNILAEQGFDKFQLQTGIVSQVAKAASQRSYGEYLIGERKNAEAIFDFSEDLMTAYISLCPPYGGRPIDEELMAISLKNAEIDNRACDRNILSQVITEQEANHVEFAHGKNPIDGVDTQFVALVEESESKVPSEDETGKIDMKDILDFTIIEPDVEVMRRVPAKEGIGGFNVKGQVIPAVDGLDLEFTDELHGVKIDENDPNLLVSTSRGHPVIMKNGVKVDKTLTVNNVAMSTGHITFDGSLMVKGEVMPGMKINVTGDIVVQGVVTNATLRAKNNIHINCGVIGADPENKEDPEYSCELKAGGDISAQYVTQTKVHAGHDLIIKEYVSHCKVDARHKVLAGLDGGKGRIFGGQYYAQSGIEAKSVGTEGIKTSLIAGSPQTQQKQYEGLLKSKNNRKTQLGQLNLILQKKLAQAKQNPSDTQILQKARAVKKVIDDLGKELKKLEAATEQIELYFKKSRYAEIRVLQTTHEQVDISINGASFTLRQEGKGGKFVRMGKDIRWENL